MRIIQFGSSGAVLILQEQIKNLFKDVVAIGGYFFFFYSKVHNSISLVLDHAKCFISLLSAWSSIVGMTCLESIFQTSFRTEVM